MPLQSLFTNALLNDIESSHLLQQTIAALQANKFVQVKIYIYTILFIFLNSSVPLENSFFFSFLFFFVVVLKCPWQPLLGRKNEMEKQRKEIKELWKQEQNKMVSIIIVSSICEHLKIMSNLLAYIPWKDAYLIL